MVTIQTNKGEATLLDYHDECPFCHNIIKPLFLYGYKNDETKDLEVFTNCPAKDCCKSFVSYFYLDGKFDYSTTGETTFGELYLKYFNKSIEEISLGFVKIYNESYAAEQHKLMEICGVGYRKALEFLIKDYSMLKNPKESQLIQKMPLAACIEKYIDNIKIKSVVKRAVWLGNDETHYIRRWGDKDIKDLKMLIDLTIHWIEMEILTQKIEEEMPENHTK